MLASDTDVEEFLASFSVDERAADALRSLGADEQAQVLARGGLDGKNPSAILWARIREHGASNQVEEFIKEEGVDDKSADSLRALEPKLQLQVLRKGSLSLEAKNPSALLAGRVRDARRNAQSGKASAGSAASDNVVTALKLLCAEAGKGGCKGKQMHGLSTAIAAVSELAMGQIQSSGKRAMSQSQSSAANPAKRIKPLQKRFDSTSEGMGIDEFLAANPVDEKAEQTFRELDEFSQDMIIKRGSLEGRNPSAVLASRIFQAKKAFPGKCAFGEGTESDIKTLQQDPMSFLLSANVDDRATKLFLQLKPHQQQLVVARGSLKGSTNASAVLVQRSLAARRW